MGCENHPSIRIICYDGTNADELTTAIAESALVIATRFHATILAMAAGRPVLPIVYSDKTLHVLEDLNFGNDYYDLREDSQWATIKMSTILTLVDKIDGHFEKLDGVMR